jgi:hypothetical protein
MVYDLPIVLVDFHLGALLCPINRLSPAQTCGRNKNHKTRVTSASELDQCCDSMVLWINIAHITSNACFTCLPRSIDNSLSPYASSRFCFGRVSFRNRFRGLGRE